MKTNYFFRIKSSALLLFSVLFLSSIFFISCSDDDDDVKTDSTFEIKGGLTGFEADIKGGEKSYEVISNQEWKVVAQEEGNWVKAFPKEGKNNGKFKIIVEENTTTEARQMNFAFVVGGKEEPAMLLVTQGANVPFIRVSGSSDITVPSAGGNVVITVESNLDWTYTLSDDSWLTEESKSDSQIALKATSNSGAKRVVTLTLTSPSSPEVTAEVTITQSSGSVILEEDFSWLNYGNVLPYETGGEMRYDLWTEEEKARGWYVTPNEFASGQQCTYARPGFVKLGKTNVGSDLISPKLDIQGTKNVKVTFKAMAYLSAAAGNRDDTNLKVFALGAGTVDVSEFEITNFPNSRPEDEEGIVNDAWAPEVSERSFIITGATSETQIKFLGGDYDLRDIGTGKNRIFLDDIKVEIIE